MKSEYDISVLLATRGRTEQLGRSVRSLFELADNPMKVQIVFAFDKDDIKGLTYFDKVLKPWMVKHRVAYTALSFTRMGYTNLHKYTNAMCTKAGGKWMIIWNDDAVMESRGWDSSIMSYDGQFKLLSFDTHNAHPYSIFPIIPREWYDLLGYLSPHPTQDGWVSQQAYMLDIMERTPIKVLHDRHDLTGNNKDDTFEERRMLEGNPNDPMDFHSPQQNNLRLHDSARLAQYMREKRGLSTSFFENVLKGAQDPWQKLKANDINSQMVQFSTAAELAKAHQHHQETSKLYNYDYFKRADGTVSWNSSSLKFGDALPALAYAHGITLDAVRNQFPEVFANGRENSHTESQNKRYIDEQLEFLTRNATRNPKNILEIGGGRGEVAAAIHKMGIGVTSIEIGKGAARWYQETGKKFFGPDWENVAPLNKGVEDAIDEVDLSKFDTIVMVESLEHIPEEKFNKVWNKITQQFHGLFIVVNWLSYHPIAVGQYASPEEHCRLVDDALYDAWTAQAKRCVFRDRSHLVLEF